ncbi:phosphatase PAP2 family protein [Mariniblastus fucicola]|uniref:PAP2 superfamily protein n=1 Tax=Mariniblastus fucicola TaxID=980251 RepID=A0A5B9PQZ0_9BACT|nr:phosphatase PAP2 family protein [Mariniblastus fucicola]QEG24901.1 PAP2 superfamily protein [Mariniblastus fucicola]
MQQQKRRIILASIFLAIGIAGGAASVVSQGPLPADIAITRFLQSTLGSEPSWAGPITQSAKPPTVWLLLVGGLGLVWIRTGWRGPVAVLTAFLSIKLVDFILRASVHTPKPIADLVAVASPSESSGFPSTFGLVYGAVFGCIVFARSSDDWKSTAALVTSIGMILIGAISRIVLGGHWTSQMVASLCLAFAIVLVVYFGLEHKRETSSLLTAED